MFTAAPLLTQRGFVVVYADFFWGGVGCIAHGGSGCVAARRAVFPRLKAWVDSYVAGFAAKILWSS